MILRITDKLFFVIMFFFGVIIHNYLYHNFTVEQNMYTLARRQFQKEYNNDENQLWRKRTRIKIA